MTKHEAAREIVRQEGNCAHVSCDDCPLMTSKYECNSSLDAERATIWLANNPEVIESGKRTYYAPIKEAAMPKYKIDPIPGMPEWFVPGIVCRVRDNDRLEWQGPKAITGYINNQYHFIDQDGTAWCFAEPTETWEPQEGEWVAAWDDNDRSNAGYRILKLGTGILFDHYARLQYPDGRVIDCACDVETLKGRTEWI